jgi:heat shock protein HslJ
LANLAVTLVAVLSSLAGSEWGPETDAKSERFIQFKDTDVTGFAGCNRFFGHYHFDGSAIRIGPLASTRMACPAEVMEAEQVWFQVLENARIAEASPNELVLKDVTGVVIATLKRRDGDD